MNETYKIYTQSPMGLLNGYLRLKQSGENVSGTINFKGKNYDFYNGKIDGNKFYFHGILRMYLKKINYTAEGEVCDDKVNIQIKTNMGNIKIDGDKV